MSKLYLDVHGWLRQNYGNADCCENSKCKGRSSTFDWALKKGKTLAKIRSHYFKLCRSCHILYDMSMKKRLNMSKSGKIKIFSPTHRSNLSRSSLGKSKSKSHRKNMSLAKAGKKLVNGHYV